ncbi:lysine 2,3-aminomutase [Nocardia sp. 2]|uniref:Lysine 2,3-aminomutase n=1 Tax=Nocardia acididurans TaxID=2802282 RepID=A0ABS1MCA5_9NOCA|nr:lysine 2,3-aminomutase [Nocardia acididurans]MBL1078273.1 lysine 2,3-aminomutase [Nocardia acididurans]
MAPVSSRPRFYHAAHLDALTARAGLSARERLRTRAVAAVLPFHVSDYVIDQLIDWDSAPDDPIYRLVFPQPDMLPDEYTELLVRLLRRNASADEIHSAARAILAKLDSHPIPRPEQHSPTLDGLRLQGITHKYPETVLYCPSGGRRYATHDVDRLTAYLRAHPAVTDLLLTGDDPLFLTANALSRRITPLLSAPGLRHIESIRIATATLARWPARFLTAPDAGELLTLFERIVRGGRNLALMAHFTHPRELRTDHAAQAARRVLDTGASIRTQGPIIRSVNDSPDIWAELWRTQTRMGMVPYYAFVERESGPREYFEVPLVRAHQIFTTAYRAVSGLCRTVRGPVMSAEPGKVVLDGIPWIHGHRYLSLRLLQCRDPSLVNLPFLARYDPAARWLDDLEPALGTAHQPPWPLLLGTRPSSARNNPAASW